MLKDITSIDQLIKLADDNTSHSFHPVPLTITDDQKKPTTKPSTKNEGEPVSDIDGKRMSFFNTLDELIALAGELGDTSAKNSLGPTETSNEEVKCEQGLGTKGNGRYLETHKETSPFTTG